MKGWLLCKTPPQIGSVDNFTVEQKTSKAGKPYLRIKRNGADYGGKPYQIVSLDQNHEYSDRHNNLSFTAGILPQGHGGEVIPEGQQQQAPAGNTSGGSRGGNPDLDAKIARQVAFKGAVELVASGKVGIQEGSDNAVVAVGALTDALLPIVTRGTDPKAEAPQAQQTVAPEQQQQTVAPQQQQTTGDDGIPF
jgi:hypothetical protein